MAASRVVTLDRSVRRNLNMKNRKTRSRRWSGGNTYCLLPSHYTLQSDRRILTIRRNILLPSSGIINIRAHETNISVLNTYLLTYSMEQSPS